MRDSLLIYISTGCVSSPVEDPSCEHHLNYY